MDVDSFSAKTHADECRLEPKRTAVLVIDMLNDFCKPGGLMVLPGAEAIYPAQRQVIAAGRESGAAIVYLVDSHRPGLRNDREFEKRARHCIEGTWGAAIVEELAPEPGDIIVRKRRYSGFFNTDLDLTLKDMNVDAVIAMGVVTNICVRSTIHDAFFLGYRCVVPEDCVAATGPREQDSSLYDIATHFGIVSDAGAVAAALGSGVPIANKIVA